MNEKTLLNEREKVFSGEDSAKITLLIVCAEKYQTGSYNWKFGETGKI